MDHCESGFAVCCVAGAACGVDIGVGCTAYRDMRVPDSNIARMDASHIHLQDDSAGRDISDSKAHVLDLDNTNIASVTDPDHGLWIVSVAEIAADARYHGPSFSDNASSRRDKERRFRDVDTVRKVGDLAISSVGS